MKKARGSLTVFLALVMTMFFSAVFAFLEAARAESLGGQADMYVLCGEDAILSNYHQGLREEYGLLFLDCEDEDAESRFLDIQQEMIETGSEHTDESWFFIGLGIEESAVSGLALATDNGGQAFIIEAVRTAKDEFGEDIVGSLVDKLTGTEEESAQEANDNALDALDDMREKASEASAEDMAQTGEGGEASLTQEEIDSVVNDNPVSWMKGILTDGVASVLLTEEEVSGKEADLSQSLEKRTLNEGNLSLSGESEAMDTAIFRLYLEKYFRNAAEEGGDGALDYEMEYIIAGKESDSENLVSVAERLLLIREAANLAYLEMSPTKKSEALAVATAICTALLIPEFSTVMQHAILAAWAFGESVYDIRTLLAGGKVPMVKSDATWHTSITSLAADAAGSSPEGSGVSYEVYLQAMLYTMSDETLAYRAMDLIEKNLDVSMDCMVAAAEGEDIFVAAPKFSRFVSIGNGGLGAYSIRRNISLSYIG